MISGYTTESTVTPAEEPKRVIQNGVSIETCSSWWLKCTLLFVFHVWNIHLFYAIPFPQNPQTSQPQNLGDETQRGE